MGIAARAVVTANSTVPRMSAAESSIRTRRGQDDTRERVASLHALLQLRSYDQRLEWCRFS
jgi:hypothetical protein